MAIFILLDFTAVMGISFQAKNRSKGEVFSVKLLFDDARQEVGSLVISLRVVGPFALVFEAMGRDFADSFGLSRQQ